MSTVKTKKAVESTKSTKSTAGKAAKAVKVSSKSASPKARPTSKASQVIDTRKPLADIIRERQLAQGLENTTAFEVKLEGGENFIVASHLSPRMNDLFDPATVTVTPKATARAGA